MSTAQIGSEDTSERDISQDVATVLAALYLRGAPRRTVLSVQRWPLVEAAMRRAGATLQSSERILREARLWEEAIALQEPGLLSWAEAISGRFVAASQEGYPVGLLQVFGERGAPPVFWRVGPTIPGPLLGVVGSRHVEPSVLDAAKNVAQCAVELGFAVVSGGAVGCDSAAAEASGARCLNILPNGIDQQRGCDSALSLCEPGEPFSRNAAMERNALIYASSSASVVIHSRFREGGTWFGASTALRRRLCPILVRRDEHLPGHRALIALGGKPLETPEDLPWAMAAPDLQRALFS